MIGLVSKIANSTALAADEHFTNTGNRQVKPVVALIIAILALLIILLAGKWLWNNVATKYITVLRPVPSVWHLLGLMLILDLVLPGCAC
jgi:hypothetical protein